MSRERGAARFYPRAQAVASWQWFNHVEDLVEARGRPLLRLNLDETSVRLFPGGNGGTVFGRHHSQRVASWQRRCCLTHIALICDNTILQPKLPQYIIGNERSFLVRDMAELAATCPEPVVLLRQKSAWSSAIVTAMVVRAIGRVIRDNADIVGGAQVVLLMDAARIHFAPAVFRACAEADILCVFIPARLTWLVQPLDTSGLALYKRYLRKAYQSARARKPETAGELSISDFLRCVYASIRFVLCGREWGAAFDGDGYGRRQVALSDRVRRCFLGDAGVVVGSARPSAEQLREVFPRRARVPFASISRQLDNDGRGAGRRSAEGSRALTPSPPGRTRSQTRMLRLRTFVADAVAVGASAAPLAWPNTYGRTRSQTRSLRSQVGEGTGAASSDGRPREVLPHGPGK